MYKMILLLFCALLMVLEGAPAQAEEASVPAVEMASKAGPPVPRPNYKRYRGNSRSKHRKMNFLRRRAARRKAMRKKKAAPAVRRGVISVDAPKGAMPKSPTP